MHAEQNIRQEHRKDYFLMTAYKVMIRVYNLSVIAGALYIQIQPGLAALI